MLTKLRDCMAGQDDSVQTLKGRKATHFRKHQTSSRSLHDDKGDNMTRTCTKQMIAKGFTLVELIIVIVILGILAAVAIPKLTSTSASAYTGTQDATLSALKSAWTVAYAAKKANPTPAEIALQMQDPACALKSGSTTIITCTAVTKSDGTGNAEFTAATDGNGLVVSTDQITITTR
jgi:prepilin-type N-terminal cleavage/methylation domain-containing protein